MTHPIWGVVQLGERVIRDHEVAGSTPATQTTSIRRVPAHSSASKTQQARIDTEAACHLSMLKANGFCHVASDDEVDVGVDAAGRGVVLDQLHTLPVFSQADDRGLNERGATHALGPCQRVHLLAQANCVWRQRRCGPSHLHLGGSHCGRSANSGAMSWRRMEYAVTAHSSAKRVSCGPFMRSRISR